MPNFLSIPLFRKILIPAFIIFLSATVPSFAEVVELTSGEIITGEITLRDEELIKIDTGLGIPITYYLDEITTIDGQPVRSADEKQAEIAEVVKSPESLSIQEVPPEDQRDEISPEILSQINEPPEIVEMPDETKVIKTAAPVKRMIPSPPSPESKQPISPTKSPLDTNEQELKAPIDGIDRGKRISETTPQRAVPKIERIGILFQKMSLYMHSQMKQYNVIKIYFMQKLPGIKKKLYEIPVRVRRNILFVSTSFMAIIYILTCFPLMLMAKKLDKKNAWLIWIPFVQFFYFVYMANKSLWWSIFFLVPILNLFLLLFLFIDILRLLKKSSWLIVPMLVPGINTFILWYLAISQTSQKTKPNTL